MTTEEKAQDALREASLVAGRHKNEEEEVRSVLNQQARNVSLAAGTRARDDNKERASKAALDASLAEA